MMKALPDLFAEMKMRLFTVFSETTLHGPFSVILSLIPRKIGREVWGDRLAPL